MYNSNMHSERIKLIEYFLSSIAFHVAVLNFAATTLHVQWLHKLHFLVPPDNIIEEGEGRR
jgi:hypothetical protein